jgi:tRNA/tmRNA/rRNA uracil-C5-methylase (TrmA/RlmC/RlmD family)
VKRSRSYLASRPVVELDIHDVAFGGAGVGRVDGKIVFVPFTIDGERVEADLIEHGKGFDRAQLKKIVLRSVLFSADAGDAITSTSLTTISSN